MSRRRSLLPPALLLITLATGCGRPPTATTLPAPVAPPPSLSHLPLPERLVAEARSRPATRVTAEELRRAVEAAGVPVPHWRQVLAGTIGASYCMAGQTAAGLALALCEFGDPASAERGRDYSQATFGRLIPGRQLSRKENVLLTVAAPPAAGAEVAAEAKRVTEIFSAL